MSNHAAEPILITATKRKGQRAILRYVTDFCSMKNKYVAKQHENQAVFGTAAQNVFQYTPNLCGKRL